MSSTLRLTLGAALAVLVAAKAAPAFAQTKIAVVDLQRALLEVDEGKRAKAQLKREFDKRQAKLDAQQGEAKALQESIKAGGGAMDPAKRARLEQDLQTKLVQLQQTYLQLQQELAQKEKALTSQIFGRMEGLLQQLAAENDVDIVLERGQGVLFAKEGLDLTGELIRRYNQRHAKKSGGKK